MQFRDQAKILGSMLLAQLDQSDRAGVVMGYRFYQYCESGELTPGAVRELLPPKQKEKEMRPATKEEIERAAIRDSFFDEPEEKESAFGSLGYRIRTWFSEKRKKKGRQEESGHMEKEYDLPGEGNEERGLVFGETGSVYGENMYRENPEWTLPEPENPEMAPYGKSEGSGKPGRYEKDRRSETSGDSETMILTPDMLAERSKKIWIMRVKE